MVNFYLAAHREASGEGTQGRSEPEPAPPGGSPSASGPWGAGLLVAFLGVAALATVAYLAFYYAQKRGDVRGPAEPASISSAGQAPNPAASAGPGAREASPSATTGEAPVGNVSPVVEESSAALEVVLDFSAECWVELVVDGRQRISELHVQGESLELAANESVVLTTVGNPAALEVRVNGRPFALGGDRGRPLHDVRIDLAALAGTAAPPAAAPTVPG